MKRTRIAMIALLVFALSTASCSSPKDEASGATSASSLARPELQDVTFRGLSFSVPSDWKVRDGGCEDGQSAVYVGDPSGGSCGGFAKREPNQPVMKLQTMDAAHDVKPEPVTINGYAGLMKDYDGWLLVVFPGQRVGVEIKYWDNRALATRILNSMRASP